MGSLIVGFRPRYGPAATPVVYQRTFVGQVIDPLNAEFHLTLSDVFLPFDKDNMTNHPHKQRVSKSQRLVQHDQVVSGGLTDWMTSAFRAVEPLQPFCRRRKHAGHRGSCENRI